MHALRFNSSIVLSSRRCAHLRDESDEISHWTPVPKPRYRHWRSATRLCGSSEIHACVQQPRAMAAMVSRLAWRALPLRRWHFQHAGPLRDPSIDGVGVSAEPVEHRRARHARRVHHAWRVEHHLTVESRRMAAMGPVSRPRGRPSMGAKWRSRSCRVRVAAKSQPHHGIKAGLASSAAPKMALSTCRCAPSAPR